MKLAHFLGFSLAIVTLALPTPALGDDRLPEERTQSEEETPTEAVDRMERKWEEEYETYFDADLGDISLSPAEIAAQLEQMAAETGQRTAVLYAAAMPDQLKLVLVTPGSEPELIFLTDVTREQIDSAVFDLNTQIRNPRLRRRDDYLEPAGQLYNWIVGTFSESLERENIDTIVFCLGEGLRAMPLAALHDGDDFIIEEYSLGQIPAFNLMEPGHEPLTDALVLAMGASVFEELEPLPAVPVELNHIISNLWGGELYKESDFTIDRLDSAIEERRFGIIHLATHADFEPGTPDNSYIQFANDRLSLDRLREFDWHDPPLDLLVLSACETAVGDLDAELGFAGLAFQSGVKSALASLWYVSDAGTLALMSEFYYQLKQTSTKSEALRKAQMELLAGNVKIEGGKLITSGGTIDLPGEFAGVDSADFSHPFFWSAFTLIGNPW